MDFLGKQGKENKQNSRKVHRIQLTRIPRWILQILLSYILAVGVFMPPYSSFVLHYDRSYFLN